MTDTNQQAPEAPKKTTLTVTIDGNAIEANPGELLIAAAERTGTYIPRFCWHPRMREVGMCRMCLVEVSGPRGMSLQPACMQPCAEGMVVDTKSEIVKKAQDGVLEFLLVNHPLDCPVCDKGGECPLQDQTLTFGPGESRFVEEKRHYEKPIPISDLVLLDRERCILCDRCTRFSKEVSGDPLIHFINRGNATEVNTFPDDPYASYFSGNVVQICPVGALTATPYRFSSRPWDLDQVESTCTSCGTGCRVVVQSSGDQLTRLQGVDSDPVNWGWLCDKGRFDFDAIASDRRLLQPITRANGNATDVTVSWSEAIGQVAERMLTYKPEEIGFIGGARLTNEDQYAFAKLAKSVLKTDNVDAQLGDGLPATTWLGLPQATINEACNASAVIVLSGDVKEELPVLFLRLRDAITNKRLSVVELSSSGSGLTRYAKSSLPYRSGEVGVLVRALINAVNGTEPADRQIAGVESADINAAAAVLSAAIASGKGNGKIVVILGRPSLAESSDATVEAAGLLLSGLSNVAFLPAMRRANLHGALDMGLSPSTLPGRVSLADGASWFASQWGSGPTTAGMDTTAMLTSAAEGKLKCLVLLGADPLNDFPDRKLAAKALAKLEYLVAIDTHGNNSNGVAHVVLPAAGFAEKSGSTTNIEGRVSRVAAKVSSPGVSRADWVIAVELAWALDGDLGFETIDDITNEIARVAPSHLGLTLDVLTRSGNADGVVVPLPVEAPAAELVEASVSASASESAEVDASAPAAASAGDGVVAKKSTTVTVPKPIAYRALITEAPVPTPDSYSLRLHSGRVLYDAATLTQASASLAPLAQKPSVHLHPGEIERHGLRAGEMVRVVSQSGDITVAMIADDRVPRGVAVVTFNLGSAGVGAADLIDVVTMRAEGVTKVRLESPGQSSSSSSNAANTKGAKS
jgi:NADH-quinone oxidoreductase subunit G